MADLNPVKEPANDVAIKPKVSGEKRRKLRRWVNRITWGSIILAPLVFAVAAIGYKLGAFDLGFAFGTLNQKLGPLMLILCGIMAQHRDRQEKKQKESLPVRTPRRRGFLAFQGKTRLHYMSQLLDNPTSR